MTKGDKIFNFINVFFMIILCILFIYPFYNVLIVSLTDKIEYLKNPLLIIPRKISFDAYKYILNNKDFLSSIKVTTFITVIGTLFSMLLTCSIAYAFSIKDFPGKKIMWYLIIFTMFFNGGLIPYYLLVKDLGMINSLTSMIIPTGINTFNMIVIKSFFEQVPESLKEAATIDGANDVVVFFRIILPISKPILATFSLYYAVFYWNQWWQGMLFIQNQELKPLQLFLRELIMNLDISEMERGYIALGQSNMLVNSDAIKMATLFVATVPILCIYPFLQKHFVAGGLAGGIKE